MLDKDRRFFARHPQRRFYVRRMHDAEREQIARASNVVINKQPTICSRCGSAWHDQLNNRQLT